MDSSSVPSSNWQTFLYAMLRFASALLKEDSKVWFTSSRPMHRLSAQKKIMIGCKHLIRIREFMLVGEVLHFRLLDVFERLTLRWHTERSCTQNGKTSCQLGGRDAQDGLAVPADDSKSRFKSGSLGLLFVLAFALLRFAVTTFAAGGGLGFFFGEDFA
jgi:hypothetical protein